MKITPILLLMMMPCFLFAQEEAVRTQVDQMPYFSGCSSFSDDRKKKRACSNQKLVRFLSQNLVYPEAAKTAAIEGTVYVSFVIDQNGLLTAPTILKDIGGDCGEAALAVLQQMPKWEAGVHEGKQVSVKLNLPIQFSLKKEADETQDEYSISYGHLRGTAVSEPVFKNNINNGVTVRDALGNVVIVEEVTFMVEKKNRKWSASNRDGVSAEMKKVARKVKVGSQFTIRATLQKGGKFLKTERRFQIVE